MALTEISAIFEKDLDRLKAEVHRYSEPESLWKVAPGISNSGGNLSLHITGNLQHFIGAILGESGYIRDRPAEFAQRDIPKEHILQLISDTKEAIVATLQSLPPEDLGSPYPLQGSFGPPNMTILQALVILAAHLNYHLGQINYHRRLLL